MRPDKLTPLFADSANLKGVGPRVAKLLENLCGSRIIDLIFHLPTSAIDRYNAPDLNDAISGTIVTLTITILKHRPAPAKRAPYRIECQSDQGFLSLVFFHAPKDWLNKNYPEGGTRVISGKLEAFRDGWQITHPDYVVTEDNVWQIPKIEPVYPLTGGLSLKQLLRFVGESVKKAPELAEWIDSSLLKKQEWPTWQPALLAAHKPTSPAEATPLSSARQRLAYDELLAGQLALSLVRTRQNKRPGRSIKTNDVLEDKIRAQLPFRLTTSQELSLHEIKTDMASPQRMMRMLQGDVGSGKTVIALLTMMHAVEVGSQAAIMAPTEILARQHLEGMEPLADEIGVSVVLLTGRDKGKVRKEKLAAIADGTAQIVIGTHALFQESVEFKDLAVVVIDEQHRFGVHQRLALSAKGDGLDMLVMTATPIPRTLTMTVYGDLDCSRITEKPPGRLPISTIAKPLTQLGEIAEAVIRAVEKGSKVYWVCPLVTDSEKVDLAAAENRHNTLVKAFESRGMTGKVGLVHGKMKSAEKDAAMENFITGSADVLVATTVIEVGVNVPAATVMVIEHAERFGLAQLHQLRGRIGRGSQKSTCILLYQGPLGEVSRSRIAIMRDTEDGFRIAEEDLKLRGGGEVLGTKQSGLPEFKLVDVAAHTNLLKIAHDDARLLLELDPGLTSPRGQAARTLLYLFEKDTAIRYLEG